MADSTSPWGCLGKLCRAKDAVFNVKAYVRGWHSVLGVLQGQGIKSIHGQATCILVHKALVLTTHSTLAEGKDAIGGEVTFILHNCTFRRKLYPQRFFLTSNSLDLTLVCCDDRLPIFTPLPMDLKKATGRSYAKGGKVHLLGHIRGDDLGLPKFTGEGEIQQADQHVLQFTSPDNLIWMPGSAGFDAWGNFAFVVCAPREWLPKGSRVKRKRFSLMPANRRTKFTQKGVTIHTVMKWLETVMLTAFEDEEEARALSATPQLEFPNLVPLQELVQGVSLGPQDGEKAAFATATPQDGDKAAQPSQKSSAAFTEIVEDATLATSVEGAEATTKIDRLVTPLPQSVPGTVFLGGQLEGIREIKASDFGSDRMTHVGSIRDTDVLPNRTINLINQNEGPKSVHMTVPGGASASSRPYTGLKQFHLKTKTRVVQSLITPDRLEKRRLIKEYRQLKTKEFPPLPVEVHRSKILRFRSERTGTEAVTPTHAPSKPTPASPTMLPPSSPALLPSKPKRTEPETQILLQGFNWESHKSENWYKSIAAEADDLVALGLTSIWLPPPSQSVAPQGYMPTDLYNLDSKYGSMADLKEAIAKLHSVGILVLADIVVNHRCAQAQDSEGIWNVYGGKMNWDARAIVSDDPNFRGRGNHSSGENFHAAPNIDHSQDFVRRDLCEWLQWLKSEVGFDGWRFDYVRGFWGGHVKEYIDASQPEFVVGEFWDCMSYSNGQLDFNQNSHRQRIVNWINATGDKAAAFDFTTKGILHAAIERCEYWRLTDDKRKPPGVLGWWSSRAVTFIDNHDTGSTQGHWRFPAGKELQGYAYILTHPGHVAIFYDHIKDPKLREPIRRLIALRKKANIQSKSNVHILEARKEFYAASIDDRIIVKIGPGDFWPQGHNWKAALEGPDYKVWERGS